MDVRQDSNLPTKNGPLDEFMGKAYALARNRKKIVLKNIALNNSFRDTEHYAALLRINHDLRNAVKLTSPKLEHIICISNDASKQVWAGIETQS